MVALWQPGAAEPAFVLGSMLPDFASMAQTRLRMEPAPAQSADEAALHAGIALHHRTDDVFHGSPEFVRLMQQTLDELSARGVGRGTARAVGHVGTEMFIDGELLRRAELADAYVSALRAGGVTEAIFRDPEGAARWELLRRRLIDYGAPHDYRDPESVLARLTAMLRGRPRLAVGPDALPILRQALPGLQRKVIAELSPLLARLATDLS